MRILVTGAAGFIGSHYVRSLLGRADAPRVTALDLLTYAGNRDNLPRSHPRMEFVRADVCDARALAEVLPGHEAVVHFAAESHVDRSVADGSAFARTNVVGTQTLLAAAVAHGVERVVHVSTDEVYGSLEHGAAGEDHPLAPNSPYAASKAGSDLIARAYWRTHGLDVSITRCSNNYGPRQHPEKLIPRFVTALVSGGRVPLYGDGRNVREWLHVEDHCRALHLVLTRGRAGAVYNVGGGDGLTNLEMTRRLLELCGADERAVERVPDRPGHDLRYCIDDTVIREELGYEPRVPFDRGLRDTVSWYRDHPDWWKPLTA